MTKNLNLKNGIDLYGDNVNGNKNKNKNKNKNDSAEKPEKPDEKNNHFEDTESHDGNDASEIAWKTVGTIHVGEEYKFTIDNLFPATTYLVRVRGRNGYGWGDYCMPIKFTTLTTKMTGIF